LIFVLATVFRPPSHHQDVIKEFADFLLELVLAADKDLTVGDFNAWTMKKMYWDCHWHSIGVRKRVRTYSLS